MAKGKERIALEEAVGASGHAVFLKVGQLAVVAVEGDGEFAARVHITKEHVGNGLTATLAAIPCLNDGLAVAALGFQGDGTARTVDKHNPLAGLFQGGKHLALGSRQLNGQTVATFETGYFDLHLLTLQTGRDAAYEHHGAGRTNLGNDLCWGLRHILTAVEGEGGHVGLLGIMEDDMVTFARLHPHVLLSLAQPVAALAHIGQCITIDQQYTEVVTTEGNSQCLVCGRGVVAFIAGREMLQLYTGGKYRGTAIAQTQRFGDAQGGCWGTFLLLVVPVGGGHARLAVGSAHLGKAAFHHLVVGEAAACDGAYVAQFVADALQDGGGMGGEAIVVAPHHHRVVGIGSHHHDVMGILGQGQQLVFILQQHHSLACYLQGQCLVFLACYY